MDMLKIRLRQGEKMVVNGAVLRAAAPTTLVARK
jgi:flagellar biosynthesis regulator FlbT